MENKIFLVIVLMGMTQSYAMQQSASKPEENIEKQKKTEKTKIEYIVRKGKTSDRDNLKALYIKVASIPGGLARTADEITDSYIDKTINAALEKGLMFVAEYNGALIGSVIKYKPEPKVFSHVMSEGSILVDPEFQGMGIGGSIFTALLNEVKDHRPDILRIEIVARESNPAIKLYERLGFVREGEFKKKIKGVSGKFESDIPMAWFNPNFKE